MTNTTIERAARALADHFGCEWETMREADRETITGYCRAVLMDVRRVPNDICETGAAAICANSDIEAGWSAMIDAILAEGET